MVRTPIIAGNWKMHRTSSETVRFVDELLQGLGKERPACEIIVAPPFTSIRSAVKEVESTFVRVRGPSIPDNNLGWEIDAGADWKLLENFSLHLLFAYWQPGNWFKYACVDKGLLTAVDVSGQLAMNIPPGFIAPLATTGNAIGSGWGVNPNRSIDPVIAFNATLNVDF